ncbi:MAG: ABC transporter ATP-binding protein [Candidatus Hydrogenedentota bacterium]
MTLLQIKNLKVNLHSHRGTVQAVRGMDFFINEQEVFGLVGESGSGKSITAYSIMRILPPKISEVSGEIFFKDVDISKLTEKEMRNIRGDRISIIFQEPMTSLNPVFTVGDQCAEVLRVHRKMKNKEIKEKVIQIFKETKIPEPAIRYNEYPHQLSGGLRQRVMIAMAIISEPDLLIADEPTTALDVTIQAQILSLLKELQEKHKMALLLITHNFGIVNEMCHRVAVMYAGEIVETGLKDDILKKQLHPYTKALINAIPDKEVAKKSRLFAIKGNVPDGITMPSGCVFHPRCDMTVDRCKTEHPDLCEIEKDHFARCLLC